MDVRLVLQEEEGRFLSQANDTDHIKVVFKSMQERALYLQKLEADQKRTSFLLRLR
jgi:hypothetical protein